MSSSMFEVCPSSIFQNHSRDFYKYHHKLCRNFDLHDDGFFDNMMDFKHPNCCFPERFLLDRFGFNNGLNRLSSSSLFNSNLDRDVSIRDDDKSFQITVSTGSDYKPEELKVNIKDGIVTIEGKHEEKSSEEKGSEGGSKRYVSRQFRREYSLPQNVEMAKVSSNLSSDGILKITAPKKEPPAIKDKSTTVPIKVNFH